MSGIGIVFEKKTRLDREEMLVFQEANLRGIPTRCICLKHLRQRKNIPADNEIAVGTIQFVHAALKAKNIKVPPSNYYPKVLEPWLHRRVWKTSLKKLSQEFDLRDHPPVFIKPQILKKFTGLVVHGMEDIYNLQCSRNLDIWCSEPVEWLTEYRVYVVNREIKHIGWYSGDEKLFSDRSVIENVLQSLWDSNYYSNNFAIDFGVLDSGETALIEMGEGYAMGAYDISPKDYFNLVNNWWNEIISTNNI